MKGTLKISVFLFFLCSSLVFSQDYYNEAIRLSFPDIISGARSMGMGNAYLSISNDVNGIIFNPAGIALSDSLQISGSFINNSYSGSTTYIKSTVDYFNSGAKFSQAGLVFPIHTDKLNFAVGLGFNQTKDIRSGIKFNGYNGESSYINYLLERGNEIPAKLYLDDPMSTSDENYTIINKDVNQSGYITESGSLNKWSLAVAFDIGKGFYIGGTINIIEGTYKSNKQTYEDDINDIYDASTQINFYEPESYDFQRFSFAQLNKRNVSGWDAKIGILYENPKNWRIGAYVKFPTQLSIEDDLFYSASSQFDSLYTYTSSLYENIKYDVKTPFEFGLGVSYDYSGFTVSGDITYIDYTSLELQESNNSSGIVLDSEIFETNNMHIENTFRGVMNYNLGLEYILPNSSLAIRAGFIMQPAVHDHADSESEINDKYENVSDFNRKYITAGVGIKPVEKVTIDMAYAHGMWDENGDNYDVYFSSAVQEVSRDIFVCSLKYELDSHSILDKLL